MDQPDTVIGDAALGFSRFVGAPGAAGTVGFGGASGLGFVRAGHCAKDDDATESSIIPPKKVPNPNPQNIGRRKTFVNISRLVRKEVISLTL